MYPEFAGGRDVSQLTGFLGTLPYNHRRHLCGNSLHAPRFTLWCMYAMANIASRDAVNKFDPPLSVFVEDAVDEWDL